MGEVYAYQSNEEVTVEGVIQGKRVRNDGLPLRGDEDNENSKVIKSIETELGDYNSKNTEEEIIVNGQSFGSGIIKSVTASAKNQAGVDKRVRVNFEFFKVGGSAVLSNEYPVISGNDFKYIKSFSESSSCDINQEVQSYLHSVNVKLTRYDGSGIASAKNIASGFLNSNNLNSSIMGGTSGYNSPPLKTFFDETYDEVNSECNFSQKYEIATNANSSGSSGAYILFISNSLNYDSNGIATVTENAEYQSLTNDIPIGIAVSGMSGAYSGCSAALSRGLQSAGRNIGQMELINIPLVKGMTIDRDTRKVTYRVNYTTNIKIDTGNYIYHEYINTKETTNAGISYSLLEGNIVGMGEINSAEGKSTKYTNAQSGWLPLITGRFPDSVIMDGSPYSFSTNHNQIKGTIGYNIKYSDCASIITGAGKIRRKIHKVSTQPTPRSLAQTFRVINNNEILQLAKNRNKLPRNYIASSIINGDSTVQMKDLVTGVIHAQSSASNYGQSVSLSYNSASRQLTAAVHLIEIPENLG